MVWLPSLRQCIVRKRNQDKFLSTSFCSIQNESYNNLIPKTSETKIMERVFVVVVGFLCVCVCVCFIQITYQTRPSLHPHSKPDFHHKSRSVANVFSGIMSLPPSYIIGHV